MNIFSIFISFFSNISALQISTERHHGSFCGGIFTGYFVSVLARILLQEETSCFGVGSVSETSISDW